MVVKVDVEYCSSCGYGNKFEEMKEFLLNNPNIEIIGHEGRRATFEVKINDTLIHSKLSTLAFPDFQDVADIISDYQSGKELRTKCKQQPITNCIIM